MIYRGNVLVTGAGGFIGCHLVTYLKRQGYWVRGVDLKYPDFTSHDADDFLLLDLRRQDDCFEATRNIDEVYALASDTGGSGFLPSRKVGTAYNTLLINLYTLEAARTRRVKRFLYVSSTSAAIELCHNLSSFISSSMDADFILRQQTAMLEQQMGEHLSLQYGIDHGIETRIVRLPNVFGPFSPWQGGRERAPAALCRKIALAKLTQVYEIEIWGDGEQIRSFCYIDDCVSALYQVMLSPHLVSTIGGATTPFTINQIVDIIAQIAGIQVSKKYRPGFDNRKQSTLHDTDTPQVVGKEPSIPVEKGLVNTYMWIEEHVRAHLFNLKHS